MITQGSEVHSSWRGSNYLNNTKNINKVSSVPDFLKVRIMDKFVTLLEDITLVSYKFKDAMMLAFTSSFDFDGNKI